MTAGVLIAAFAFINPLIVMAFRLQPTSYSAAGAIADAFHAMASLLRIPDNFQVAIVRRFLTSTGTEFAIATAGIIFS